MSGYLNIARNFIVLSLASISIGLFFGILTSLMTKYFRFIAHSAIGESALFISLATLGYFFSELA